MLRGGGEGVGNDNDVQEGKAATKAISEKDLPYDMRLQYSDSGQGALIEDSMTSAPARCAVAAHVERHADRFGSVQSRLRP